MEGNREAAAEWVARAEAALLESDYARALRLFVKAQTLYPLEGLATKIESAQAFQAQHPQQQSQQQSQQSQQQSQQSQQQSQSQQAPPPQAPPPPRPPSPPPAPYISTTPSDAEVDRVLSSGGCHYAVLGLARTVLAADLKKNYHKLCLRLHPDKAAHPQATQAFQLVQAAFAALKEPAERAAYDIRSRVPSAAEAKAAREARAGSHPGYSARQPYNPPPPPPPPPPPASLAEALQRELVRCTVDELKRMRRTHVASAVLALPRLNALGSWGCLCTLLAAPCTPEDSRGASQPLRHQWQHRQPVPTSARLPHAQVRAAVAVAEQERQQGGADRPDCAAQKLRYRPQRQGGSPRACIPMRPCHRACSGL